MLRITYHDPLAEYVAGEFFAAIQTALVGEGRTSRAQSWASEDLGAEFIAAARELLDRGVIEVAQWPVAA